MTQTLSIEIDTPPSIYRSSSEFTGQLIDRQLHRPLFAEAGSSILPDLLTTHDKVGDSAWVFRIADDATWGTGEAIMADELGQWLLRVTHQPRSAWIAALLKRCDVLDDRTLRIETRLAVAILDRILANPLFAPRRRERSSGAYAFSRIEGSLATLVPRDSTLGSIQLVTTKSRAEGQRLFHSGTLDIGWGIGVPPDFWSDCDPGPFPGTGELDMYVIATAGLGVPEGTADRILESLRLDHDAPAGIESTRSRYWSTPLESGRNPEDSVSTVDRWPLYYTDFPPNRELAEQLAKTSGGYLVPTRIDYTTMVEGTVPIAGFSLQIHATQFPDTLGLQIESLLVARGSIPAPDTLRSIAVSAWEAETESQRLECVSAAERGLDRILRRRVIGRVRPRFRSRIPIELSRSGWLDFKHLAQEKAQHEPVATS